MIETIEALWAKAATAVMSVFVVVQSVQESLPQLQAALPAALYDVLAGATNKVALWTTAMIAAGGAIRGAWATWKNKQRPEVQ